MATRRPAAKRATQVLKALRAELESGWTPGLTVLTGDDLFRLDSAQRSLLEHLAPSDAGEMTLTVFGREKVDVGAVVGAARSLGMFSTRRVVLLHELSMLDGEPDALVAYAKNPPPQSFLIVRAPEMDKRRKLHKALATKGRLLTFASPAQFDPRDAVAEARALAKRKKLTLSNDAAAFLSEIAPGDLYRLDGELEKLRAFKGPDDSSPVTLDEARDVAAGSDHLSGWEVANAITERDRAGAFAAVARLVTAGVEPLQILGGVSWRARVMLQAKALQERGAPASEIVQATRAWYFKDQLLSGISRYSLKELIAFPKHLRRADQALKGSNLDGGTVLEALVENLTGTEQR